MLPIFFLLFTKFYVIYIFYILFLLAIENLDILTKNKLFLVIFLNEHIDQ